jgi:hypothetical protein
MFFNKIDHPSKDLFPISRPEYFIRCPLGMGHHGKDISFRAEYGRNMFSGTIRVAASGTFTCFITEPECDLMFFVQGIEQVTGSDIAVFLVCNGRADYLCACPIAVASDSGIPSFNEMAITKRILHTSLLSGDSCCHLAVARHDITL